VNLQGQYGAIPGPISFSKSKGATNTHNAFFSQQTRVKLKKQGYPTNKKPQKKKKKETLYSDIC